MPTVTVKPPLDTTPLLTGAEVCRYFKITDSTLKLWKSRGLPVIGGERTRPRYRLSDVLKWVEGREALLALHRVLLASAQKAPPPLPPPPPAPRPVPLVSRLQPPPTQPHRFAFDLLRDRERGR